MNVALKASKLVYTERGKLISETAKTLNWVVCTISHAVDLRVGNHGDDFHITEVYRCFSGNRAESSLKR